MAGQQWGVIGWAQLEACGFSRSAVDRWQAAGKLHLIHRGVYALGHPSVPIEGRLVAALLHGGAGAVLSHATAAWWWGIVAEEPRIVDVSTESRARSTDGVRVHHPRTLEATRHRRFPITTVARTIADLAVHSSLNALRRVLAEADYRGLLRPDEVASYAGRGSKKLNQALERHQPRLARTRSDLETAFLALCEREGLPIPDINAKVSRMRIDAVWPAQRVAVELDGYQGHHTPAQLKRDRRRELHARNDGFVLIRYSWDQVFDDPDPVAADLRRALSWPGRSAG